MYFASIFSTIGTPVFLILSFLLFAEPKKEEAVKSKPIKVFKSEMGYETVLVDVTPFTMGERQGSLLQDDDERPFSVQLTHSFYMGQKEVTRGFWRSIMGNDPNAREGGACLRSGTFEFPDNDSPVYCVDWFEAVEFANQLSTWEGFEQCYIVSGNQVQYPKGHTCKGYRLPTEAEWEYAARGLFPLTEEEEAANRAAEQPPPPVPLEREEKVQEKPKTKKKKKTKKEIAKEKEREKKRKESLQRRKDFAERLTWSFAGGKKADEVAWYQKNSKKMPQMVGIKKKSPIGLYDMSGNVWEWCNDWYAPYPNTNTVDPMGAKSGLYKVLRGGSWASGVRDIRIVNRFRRYPTARNNQTGFRLVRTKFPETKKQTKEDNKK